MIGPKDVRTQDLPDPDGSRFGVPTYYWGTAPAEAGQTVRQLRTQGLRPKSRREISAQVIRPRRSGDPLTAYLYRDAVTKTCTPAQREAAARATRARQQRDMQRRGLDTTPEAPEFEGWNWDGFDR